jgi:tetratricopeptide (TPR) repeat protein/TolB-like protein
VTTVSFLGELRRRRVLHVAGAYIAIAWLVTEIASFLLEQVGAPAWSIRLLAIAFVVGFPIAIALAWTIQVGPDGERRVDPSTGQRRTVIWAATLGVVATAGLSWLILPTMEDMPLTSGYEPISDSLAILPMADPDSTPHQRTVADTLYTSLLNGLNESRDLTQVRLDYAREFKVARLLVGQIIQTSTVSRVELQLLDVAQGNVSWSSEFEWDPSRVMDIGPEIANGILEAMSLQPLSRRKFTGTDDAEAYDAFLLGSSRTDVIDDLRLALQDFERAIELDPGFVNAHVALADTIRWYLWLKGPPEAERQTLEARAKRAIDTAIELDSESPAALSTLALIEENRELKQQLYLRALALDPGHAITYYRFAQEFLRGVKTGEAERYLRKATELDPMNAHYRAALGGLLLSAGRNEEGKAELTKSIELEPTLESNYRTLSAWEYFTNGRIDQFIYWMRRAYSVNPQSGVLASFVAGGYADLVMRTEAVAWKDRALALSPTSAWAWQMAGAIHARLGDHDIATEYFDRAVELGFDPATQLGQAVRPRTLWQEIEEELEAGRKERALQLFADAYPEISNNDSLEIGPRNVWRVVDYAGLLIDVGREDEGQALWNRSLAFVEDRCRDGRLAGAEEADWCDNLFFVHARRKQRDETLAALRRLIVDQRRIAEHYAYAGELVEFIKDDPEYMEIMSVLNEILEKQRKRVHEMECNDEMPPAPYVDLAQACN